MNILLSLIFIFLYLKIFYLGFRRFFLRWIRQGRIHHLGDWLPEMAAREVDSHGTVGVPAAVFEIALAAPPFQGCRRVAFPEVVEETLPGLVNATLFKICRTNAPLYKWALVIPQVGIGKLYDACHTY